MRQEIREQLRKQRGTPVFVYDANDFTLLYVFDSKTHMYGSISIHHKTLNDCIDSGEIYLDTFFLSLDQIEESTSTNLLTLDEIKALVLKKREIYEVKHPASKAILASRARSARDASPLRGDAEFKDDSSLNREFSSLNSLASPPPAFARSLAAAKRVFFSKKHAFIIKMMNAAGKGGGMQRALRARRFSGCYSRS